MNTDIASASELKIIVLRLTAINACLVWTHSLLFLYDYKQIEYMYLNCKECNEQESIQLPNTFRPWHQRERRNRLKQLHQNQNITSRKPKGQFLSQKIGQKVIQNKNYTRTYMQKHTVTVIVIKVREKSRECHSYKPQSFPDTKRKREQTKPNKRKSNKRMKTLRLALSSPNEVIAMLKGPKNTRTKQHQAKLKTSRLVE